VARQPLDLVINPDPSFPEVNLASDDVLFNSVTSMTQLCNDGDWLKFEGFLFHSFGSKLGTQP
jgi:hypothetical protein